MSNPHFKQWTRSTSFALTLHEEGVRNLLLALVERRRGEAMGAEDIKRYGIKLRPMAANYLVRRGLIEMNELDEYALTEAGMLTARLLEQAGFGA